MTASLRHFLLAIQFFTRIPVTGRLAEWVGFSPAMLRASAAHFPGVGVIVGGLVAALTAVLLHALPPGPFSPLLAAVLGTVFSVMLTGGFHEDGLADVADGLGGSQDRERALIIMKDSRVGAFGVLAVVLALLVKVAVLALLGAVRLDWMLSGIFAAHVVSRTWPLLLIRWMPYVGDAAGSKAKPLADQISVGSLLAALVWCVCTLTAVAAVQAGWAPHASLSNLDWARAWPLLSALAGSGIALALMARLLWRRLQGFTGDGLGATQQICEIAFYLGLALAL